MKLKNPIFKQKKLSLQEKNLQKLRIQSINSNISQYKTDVKPQKLRRRRKKLTTMNEKQHDQASKREEA